MNPQRFRDLIAKYGSERWATTFLYDAGPGLLALKAPWLCPECGGTGDRLADGEVIGVCLHGRAPSIEQLLTIGQKVWTTDVSDLRSADTLWERSASNWLYELHAAAVGES